MRLGPLALLSSCVLLSSFDATPFVRIAHAQTEADLDAARALFKEAMKDESSRQYETALGKYRRVASVKDTSNVRYRIATCLEALGQRAAALVEYEAAVRLAEGDKTALEAMHASQARIAQLDRVVARLTLVLSPKSPRDADIKIDDASIGASMLGAAIPVDPGPHTISATARDAPPFRTSVTLPEGGRASVTVSLEPAPAGSPATAPPRDDARTDTVAPVGSGGARDTPPPSPPSGGPPTGAIIAAVAGGALLIGSGVSLALRSSDISKLDSACPGGRCPADRESELQSVRSRALVEGPLALGLGIGGAIALGVGITILVSSSGAPAPATRASISVTPAVSPSGGGFVFRSAF